jgi:putative Ig domain-containing protein/IPT/TIG domain-containing protein/VCBS repeat protein/fibronectin type III domain protein
MVESRTRPVRRSLRCSRILAVLIALFGFVSTAHAGSIVLTWDASESGDVDSYIVVYGTASGFYTTYLAVGNQTSATVRGLADGQTYYFAVEACSASGACSSPSNEMLAVTSNTPPHLTNPGPQVSGEGVAINLPVSAIDAENDPLVYSATGLPSGLFINSSTGVVSGTIAFTEAGTHAVTLTVSDGPTTTTAAFTWTVQSVDRQPIIGVLANRSTPVGAVVSLQATAIDPDFDALAYSATGLPPGLTIGAATGLITGTLNTAGSYSVTVSAADGTLSSTSSFTWTVLASNNTPTLTSPGNQESSVVNPVWLQVSAADADGNTLVFAASDLPPGLALNSSSGLITGQPTTTGVYTVTVTVSDGLATAGQTFSWTIDPDRPPTVTNPGDQNSVEGQFISMQIAASDPDGQPVSYTASLPAGLSLSSEGLITGVLPSGSAGQSTAVVTVSDGGHLVSVTFLWTISTPTATPPIFVTATNFAADRNDVEQNRAELALNVSGVDTLLIVAFHSEFDGGDTDWSVQDNGVQGTLITSLNGYTGGDGNQRFRIYYWLNPPQGPNSIVVQNSLVGSNELTVSAILFSNVLQADPLGAVAADVSTSGRTSESETVATNTSDLVLHVIADALFVRGNLGDGETSIAVANDGLTKSGPGDGDASLWASTKLGGSPSTTVSSSGWASSPSPAPRVINGVAIALHGAASVLLPDFTVASTHVGAFTRGQTGATYLLTVTNSGTVPTGGTVTVSDTLPGGLTATGLSGPGWSCSVAPLTCSRSDVLAPGASYPPITLTVNVASDAPGTVTNTATVIGIDTNIANDTATDPTTIVLPGASATPTFVQRNYAVPQSSLSSVTVSFTAAQTAGDLNVVVVGWNDSTQHVQSVTDSKGNVYTSAVGPTVMAGFGSQSIYYAKNISAAFAAENSVTVTFDGPAAFPDIRIAEYSGIDLVNPIDVTAAAQGSDATSDSGTLTTTNAVDLLLGANLVKTATMAAGNGYISRVVTVPDGDILMDRVVSATGSYSATAPLSSAGPWIMQLVAFRAAGSSPPPLITSRTPGSGPVGAAVTLTGDFFGVVQGTSRVEFNGLAAVATTWSDTRITALVPAGATSGNIVVTVGGLASNPASFTVVPTPALSYRTPASGPVGATVTLAGTSFGAMQGSSTVTFNGKAATATDWSDTSITALVPAAAASGNIIVTVDDLASNGLPFTVTIPIPTLTSRTPATGSPGAAVTLTGTNFGATPGASTVTFNGTAALPSAWSDTSIVVSVPAGATSGNIIVTVSGLVSNGLPFGVNRPPALVAIANLTSEENTTVLLSVSVTDPDGDPVTYSATGLPPGLAIDPSTGLISGTLTYASAGVYTVTVFFDDGHGSVSQTFTWTVTNVNRSPVLTNPGNQIHKFGTVVSLPIVATDPDGTAVTFVATNLPGGLTINPTTGVISGIPGYASVGVFNVTVTASDGSLTATQNFTWTVKNRLAVHGDFGGDGKSDIVVFRRSTASWYLLQSQTGFTTSSLMPWGASSDVVVPGDYDGDGKEDVATYRPSTGEWTIKLSSTGATQTVVLGSSGDIPAPGDYDGDGKTDVAIFHSGNAQWTILQSGTSTFLTVTYGQRGDMAVAADYDGDGITDLATYRPAAALWTIRQSSNEATVTITLGEPGATPVPADYDGDGKTDAAIYQPSTGLWSIRKSSTGTTQTATLGGNGAVPAPGDYDGDGKADIAIFGLNGQWTVVRSTAGMLTVNWGISSDIPVMMLPSVYADPPLGSDLTRASDFDGDGKNDLVVFRKSTGSWYILQSHSGYTTSAAVAFAASGVVLVPGDYDADGVTDVATYTPSTGVWTIRLSNTGTTQTTTLGGYGYVPVPGDYDGDGKTDIAIFNTATAQWTVLWSSTGTTTAVVLGVRGEYAVPGDYDGDGETDFATYRPTSGLWTILRSSTGTTTTAFLGGPGARPVPADYDGDGKADPAVYQPATGQWSMLLSTTGATSTVTLGGGGAIPVPGDYDGDGKADVAVFASTGQWSIVRSSSGTTLTVSWGVGTDVPVMQLPSVVASPPLGTDVTRATDFDGDGVSDLVVHRPSTGSWYFLQSHSAFTTSNAVAWGTSTDIPVAGDYDGDGKADPAYYRPSTGQWAILQSGTNTMRSVALGTSGDLPVPGDYDGDGKTDVAIFHPPTGLWSIVLSSTGATQTVTLGGWGDVPVPRDFDGDGKTDIAIYHPSTGQWFIVRSTTGTIMTVVLGLPSDIPVPGDYDGDGKADPAVYHPATAVWSVLQSTTSVITTSTWGVAGDLPVPADYDGDGMVDMAVFHGNGQWQVHLSNTGATLSRNWGLTGDVTATNLTLLNAIVAMRPKTDTARQTDYDGDGKADIVVFRASAGTWHVLQSHAAFTTSVGFTWGTSTDKPVPGDYDGDGKTDLAFFRPSTGEWKVLLSSTNFTSSLTIPWGATTDRLVPGDYDGDGKTDIAYYRPSTGEWKILTSSSNFTSSLSLSAVWGASTDIPVPGDYDGDGKTDLAVFHANGQWQILLSSTNYTTSMTLGWGVSTDVPVPADYDGDGKTDAAVYRPSTGSWYFLFSKSNFTASTLVAWGGAGSVQVVGDYDGDGKADLALFAGGAWNILLSGVNYTTSLSKSWGFSSDKPLPIRP